MHLKIALLTSPRVHEKLIRKTNQVKYPFEGKVRKGYCIPYTNEWRFYDFRIKKECAPQFLKDINAFNPSDYKVPKEAGNFEIHTKMRMFKFLIWLSRKMLGLKNIEYKDLEVSNEWKKVWEGEVGGVRYYAILLGVLNDPKRDDKEEL